MKKKVYVVTSYTWYDEYGESYDSGVEGVFSDKSKAQEYINKHKTNNTKSRGTDYAIEEQEMEE